MLAAGVTAAAAGLGGPGRRGLGNGLPLKRQLHSHITGGRNIKYTIPLCEPWIDLYGQEFGYAVTALATNNLCTGPFIARFEDAMAKYLGVQYAVAVSSGTAALHLVLLACGVGKGDLVMVNDLTFVAPVNAIRYCGAEPVLVDIDEADWQVNTNVMTDWFRPKVYLPVALLGGLPILWSEPSTTLILDASQGLGNDGLSDAIHHATAAILSFNGNKLITAAGGGMVVTNDGYIAEGCRHWRNQARANDTEVRHDDIGYNYRLSNLQAAVGLAQLETIEERLRRKRLIAERYDAGLLTVLGISTRPRLEGDASWLYTIKVDAGVYGWTSRDLLAMLADKGIETRPLWTPMHRLPMYERSECLGSSVADDLWCNCLSLPSGCGLMEAQQETVITAIRALAREA